MWHLFYHFRVAPNRQSIYCLKKGVYFFLLDFLKIQFSLRSILLPVAPDVVSQTRVFFHLVLPKHNFLYSFARHTWFTYLLEMLYVFVFRSKIHIWCGLRRFYTTIFMHNSYTSARVPSASKYKNICRVN